MEKLLTISIAAFNVETTIGRAVESLISESTCDYLEVMIINDGSTDATSCIGKQLAEKYPDTVTLINKENGGYGSTVNYAIKNAKGKYFKLLDGDDWYDTKGLCALIEALKEKNADMVISTFYEVTGNEKKLIEYSMPEKQVLSPSMVKENILMHAICYRTEILRRADFSLPLHCLYTDALFCLIPMYYINTVYYIPSPVYMYSLGNDEQSVSFKSRVKHLGDLRKVNEIMCTCSEKEIHNGAESMIKEKMYWTYYTYIETILQLKVDKESKKLFVEADKNIFNKNKELTENMMNRKLRLLRKSNYLLYPIVSMMYKMDRNK